MDGNVEKEMCNNCKKEIPQQNYVMHTMHCARNITLCKVCNEPIPKIEYEIHREKCRKPIVKKLSPPPTNLENSHYFQHRKAVEDKKAVARRENYLKRHEHLLDTGFKLNETVRSPSRVMKSGSISSNVSSSSLSTTSSSNSLENRGGAIKKPPLIPRLDDTATGTRSKGNHGLLACRYCDLELPKLDLEEHENYCGSRTDKCLDCGELVMFKNKQFHCCRTGSKEGQSSLKSLWDSTTERHTSSNTNVETDTITSPTRRRFNRVRLADVDYDPLPYLPAAYQPGGGLRKNKEGESYKEISRRLDCPTALSLPPPRRRRNPPTELTILCEFCDTPIPHEELIQHEAGCRPDIARFNPRRSRTTIPDLGEDDYTPAYEAPRMRSPPRADSPDSEELPCEFCSNMVPASQLWRHQLSCTSAA
ncbi:hypothetical protein ABEB36_007926 [Hypothenemus hampei]|uniref:TRAFD1/XAF1 zinc finger domain-containing protein n=1 Tax=Hypothenemus hampei TaxID=57062 RepID=A0ABD1EY38_HYPHA